MRLLLVEDTEDMASALVESFTRRGDAMDWAGTVMGAQSMLAVQDYDLAILDIQLPDGKGTEILSMLRKAGRALPVLMLTARGEVGARIAALDGGADDYMVKPFDLMELHARVRALVRRIGGERSGTITFGDLTFDPAGLELTVAGTTVAMTRREFSLLEVLLANRGRVVGKDKIHDRMFSFNEEEVGLNTVETYIARLRRKLEGSCVTIRTLRGLGYQLVADA